MKVRRLNAAIFFAAAALMADAQVLSASRDLHIDRFEAKNFAATGGLYYKKNAEQEAGTVEFQSEVTRSGKGALKLSVRPHCDKATAGCSERAEVWERPELWVPYSQGIWYAFSVKFADPIPKDDHRYVIAQWKREIAGTEGDFSPFLALRLNRGKLFATVETNLVKAAHHGPQGKPAKCPQGETPVWLRPDTNQTRALVAVDDNWNEEMRGRFTECTAEIVVTRHGSNLPAPASGWMDFAIYTKPGPDGTGHIEIFANNGWVATIKGRIGHAEKGLGDFQYFKFGPYRDAHDSIWTLYYDDFRRSPDCADVLAPASCPF